MKRGRRGDREEMGQCGETMRTGETRGDKEEREGYGGGETGRKRERVV